MNDVGCPIALVTGGSRGVGAATILALAERGYDVALTYRNKAARATEVADEASKGGAAILPLAADVTKQDELARLFAAIVDWRGRLDLVVLNASGGLERDLLAADPDYPPHINRDAQVAVVEGSLPLMHGGTIVFVTSHWAHLYGRVTQLPTYEPIAASKHAGEQVLRALRPRLATAGVRLIVVTGDLIEGTITAKLLERAAPGLAADRQDAAERLPTASDMAAAIVSAAIDDSLPGGSTVVVGGALDSIATKAS
jgi:NAD(P)-dependent dehydrogenase (short-subunit alcohol dehydrogenase family)